MSGEKAIFNLEIKKKNGSSIYPDINHSKVSSSDVILYLIEDEVYLKFCDDDGPNL